MATTEAIDEDDRVTDETKLNTSITVEMTRKEKRKLLKKLKRKNLRKEIAIKAREIENDPLEEEKLRLLEQEEAERMEKDRIEFEASERRFLEELERKRRLEVEEEERRKNEEDLANNRDEHELNEDDDDWEYVEDGPAEIIWKGNEIIVKKKKVRVPKKVSDPQKENQESERPISNPLAPQSEVFEDYKSAQEVLKSVAQQVPNFGTEQDKAHCPFHLKTGVCRFGASCSRVHFYPDKSCTLLIKNMYSGPNFAWEHGEGLEYTDEEVERSFEEFYEDVHTEFLKFGEILNFKVCKNASSHLRGNVYVHYKLLESAVLAYQAVNGRFFAGKQLSCEFINLTRWKVAICGEYMRSRHKTCSRGSACNFIHCFRNPGGDYEWADWEKPAPRYWLKEMAALFGYSGDRFTDESLRYHPKRSRSRDPDSTHRRSPSNETAFHRSRYLQGGHGEYEEKISPRENNRIKRRKTDSVNESTSITESGQRLTRQASINRDYRANTADKPRKREGGESGDRSIELKSRTSSRRKHDSEPVHEHHHLSEKFDQSEDFLHRKKERDTRHSHKSLPMEDEADLYLSDSSSNESRLGRDGRSPNKRRSISRSNTKSDYREYKRRSGSLERDEDRCHNHNANSSRSTHRNEKRHKRNRRSQGSDNQSDFTETEGERRQYRTDSRHRKSTKRRKHVKHKAESSDNASDGGRSLRSEKKPRKDRRTRSRSGSRSRSRSKNDFDLLDDKSNVRKLHKEKRHNEEFGSSKADFNEYKRAADCEKIEEKEQADVSNYRPDDSTSDIDGLRRSSADTARPYLTNPKFHDSSLTKLGAECRDSQFEGPVATRDPTSYKVEHISPMNNDNYETTTSQRIDGKTEAELEQAYRMAALKKLEEMKRCKDSLPIQSMKIAAENAEGGTDLEGISCSREVGTSVASVRRRI